MSETIESLRQQLASFQESTKSDWERIRILQGKLEAYEMASAIVSSVDSISVVADLREQLAECQAQVKTAKREALLDAAITMKIERYFKFSDWLRRMAKELE